MTLALTATDTGPIDSAQVAQWVSGARSSSVPTVETVKCPHCGKPVEVTPVVVALMNRRIDRFVSHGMTPIRMTDWQCPDC